jgi:hypothetical protein
VHGRRRIRVNANGDYVIEIIVPKEETVMTRPVK